MEPILIWWSWTTSCLAFGYLIILSIYIVGWNRIPTWTVPHGFSPSVKCSVIVSARNEAMNITACLTSLTQLRFPATHYEVIVVDDHSTDNTWALVQQFAEEHQNIHGLRLANHLSEKYSGMAFKKKAIALGISKASGDLIVTTDADCEVPPDWLALITSFYEEKGCSFVAAPVAFHREVSLLERFQSLDLMGVMCATAAGIHLRIKNLCNGANLAYRRAAFYEVNGFSGIDHLPTGDDILLMQKIAARYPGTTGFLKNAAATVLTRPQSTVREFVSQRVRWASKSTEYKEWTVTIILGWVFLYCVAMVATLALIPIYGWVALGLWSLLFSVKAITDYFYLGMMAKFFRREDLMKSYLPAQCMHIAYIVTIGLLGFFVRRYQWKGRKVK